MTWKLGGENDQEAWGAIAMIGVVNCDLERFRNPDSNDGGFGMERQLNYWKRQLAGSLPILQWPTNRPRSAMESFGGAVHHFVLPTGLTEALKALSQQEAVTLFMILFPPLQTLPIHYTPPAHLFLG